jgi:glucokinase
MIGAVDIGGTKIAVGVVDERGVVMQKSEIPSDPKGGFEAAMRRTAEALRDCARRAGTELKGIGIGSAGPLNVATGALGNVNNLIEWEGGNPVEVLAKEFGVRVAIENDADAVALGEVRRGAMRDKSRVVFVTVGTGIGVSVILEGRIYRGVENCHPESGHHVIEALGPECNCGARGCWEALASGPAMEAEFGEGVSAREICRRAQQGDEKARRAVEREGFYLGVGLGNLVIMFAPEAIVLGGSVMKSADLFLGRIGEVIAKNCTQVPYQRVEIGLASLKDVNLVGAAEVWRHRFGG